MAGIFYLPRLYVHHSESVVVPSSTDILFRTMEKKLLNIIMTPAMVATWAFGIGLALVPGVIDWNLVWPWIKLLSILCMTAFHFWLLARQKVFEQEKREGVSIALSEYILLLIVQEPKMQVLQILMMGYSIREV